MFQSKRCWKCGNLFSLTLNLKLKMEMDTNQIIIIMTISIMSFKLILLYAAELETKFHLFMDCLCVCILIANYKCVLLNGYRVSIDVFRFVWGEAEWLVPLFYRLYFYRYFTVFLRVIFHIYTQSDWPLFRLNTPQLLLYLFSLCFQWLQVVGDIFQLFLKVTWFTDQCKKDEKQKKRK